MDDATPGTLPPRHARREARGEAPLPENPVPRGFDLVCEHCGYSLVGLTGNRCPECGRTFDPNRLPIARIPWLFRKRLGVWHAYAATVRMILFAPGDFAEELSRPVRISADDAADFRALTVFLSATTFTLAIAIGLQARYAMFPLRPYTAVLFVACVLVWILSLVWLQVATDLPTFIWRGLPARRKDLSPLHQYACAPLSLVPPIGLLLAAGFFFGGNMAFNAQGRLTSGAELLLIAMLAPVVLALWVIPAVLMGTATRCGWGRRLVLLLYLPLHWALVTLMVLLSYGVVAFLFGRLW